MQVVDFPAEVLRKFVSPHTPLCARARVRDALVRLSAGQGRAA